MLKPMAILLLSLMLLGLTEAGRAQANFWEQTNGPRSAHVNVLAIKSNDTIFAGTANGVLRSTDDGESWEECGLSNMAVNTLVITPNGCVFAGTEKGGMHRSADNGLSWDPVNTGLASRSIFSLATNSTGELVTATGSWEVGFSDSAVYRSTDYGDHWTRVSSLCAPALAVNDSGHIFVGSPHWGVARSTDHGASWVWCSLPGIPHWWMNRLLVNSRGHVFAATWFGIFRSTNDGASWDSASSGLQDFAVQDLASTSRDTLFAAVYLGVAARSTDNGTSWRPTTLGGTVRALAASRGGHVFAGGVSIFRSTDAGESWSTLDVGWQDFMITSLAVNGGDTLYAGSWGQGLFCSTDHGDSWRELSTGWGESLVHDIAINARGHLFVSYTNDVLPWTARSTDYGEHWVDLPQMYFSHLVFNDSGHIFAIGSEMGWGSAVFRSTDNGDTWDSVSTGIVSRDLGSLVINSRGDLFVTTAWENETYRSTNGGARWTPFNIGPTGRRVEFVAADSRGNMFAVSSANVFRSTDNGESWVYLYTIPAGTGISWIGDIVSDAAGNLFVATVTGVYRNGVPLNSGLTDLRVRCLAMDSGGYIFAGTGYTQGGGGLFRSVQPTTSVKEVSAAPPAAFMLEQNYPNPFNPTTKIQFTIVDQQLTIVKVYDLLGRKLATLVNEVKQPGTYTVQFDASGLASGVYYYRLQSGNFVSVKKMVLVR